MVLKHAFFCMYSDVVFYLFEVPVHHFDILLLVQYLPKSFYLVQAFRLEQKLFAKIALFLGLLHLCSTSFIIARLQCK